MSFRKKQRASTSVQAICKAVKTLFDCAFFSNVTYQVNSQKSPQLSLFEEAFAHSSSPIFDENTLSAKIKSYSPGSKKLFAVMCGETDNRIALIYSLLEIVKAGSLKNVIVTDSVTERDNLAASFELICSLSPQLHIYVYILDSYDTYDIKELEHEISSFITDTSPSLLIIGRDSLCRNDNLINRSWEGKSLSGQISYLHPVVLTISDTVESVRSVAAASEIFSPSVTLMFSREVKKIKSPQLYPLTQKGAEPLINYSGQIGLK